MYVHTCCCIFILRCFGLIEICKRIEFEFKLELKYVKKIGKEFYFPLSSSLDFGPSSPARPSFRRSGSALSLTADPIFLVEGHFGPCLRRGPTPLSLSIWLTALPHALIR